MICTLLLLKLSFVDKWATIIVFARTLHVHCADMPNYIILYIYILLSKSEGIVMVDLDKQIRKSK